MRRSIFCRLLIPAGAPFATLVKETASRLRALSDASLLHDHLCPINDPVYFGQFWADAAARGLRYLGDAQLQAAPPPEVAAANPLPGEKPAVALFNFAPLPARTRNRFWTCGAIGPFRQSLLCRADAPPARPLRD